MTLKLTFSVIALTLLLGLAGKSTASVKTQTPSVTLSLPIKGSFAIPVGKLLQEKLDVINTFDGRIQTIPPTLGPYNFPTWDKSGDRIAYFSAAGQSVFSSISTNITQTIKNFPNHNHDELFYPAGWSFDGKNLLYQAGLAGIPSSTTTFYLMDVATSSLTVLPLTYQTNQIITNIPSPTGLSGFSIVNTNQVKRNLVDDNWVAIQITAQASASTPTTDSGIPLFFVDILWNYTIGQMISLDNLVNDPISSSDISWSPDGQYLLLTTRDSHQNEMTHILRFQDDGNIQLIDSAPTSRSTEFWLGAGNLLIARSLDSTTNEFVDYIGEIINGTWHEIEFFRLHGDEFRAMRPGDWYIRASEQEKQTLSCAFDQTLPTRLQMGTEGKITAGASSRLRAAPTTYSAEVGSLTAGTSFSVISGAWCANGYRWWNIQLSDGRSGWAAEADKASYFLEPTSKS